MEDLAIQKRELFDAIAHDDLLQVRRLTATNISPYHRNAEGKTALDIAIQKGNSKIIRLLRTSSIANVHSRQLFLSADVISTTEHASPIAVLAAETLSETSSTSAQFEPYSTLFLEFGRPQLRRLSTNYSALLETLIPASKTKSKAPSNKNSKGSQPIECKSFQPQRKQAARQAAKDGRKHSGLSTKQAATVTAAFSTTVHRAKAKVKKHLRVVSSAIKPDYKQPSAPPERDLAAAVSINDIQTVQDLLKSRIDLRPKNWYDKPALVIAAEKGFLEMVKILVSAGAGVNNGYDRLPLHCAAENGDLDMVQFLLSAGAYLEAREVGDLTALMTAAAAGQLVIVEALVSRGANVKAVNPKKETALMLAAKGNHQSVYNYLLPRSPQPISHTQAAYAPNALSTLHGSATPSFSKTSIKSAQTPTVEDPIEQAQQILDSGLQEHVEGSLAPIEAKTVHSNPLQQGYREIIQAMDRPIDDTAASHYWHLPQQKQA